MGKKILASLLVAIALLVNACSSDSVIGEWAPDNDTSGNTLIKIKSGGTAEYKGDADDGTYRMKGTWSYVGEDEKTINVKFDASTIKVDLDNSLAEEFMKMGLQEMASHTLTLTLSEDGEHLDGGGNGYFVRY